jgi:hypothetical protein
MKVQRKFAEIVIFCNAMVNILAVNHSSSCQDISSLNSSATSATLKQDNLQALQARLNHNLLTSIYNNFSKLNVV